MELIRGPEPPRSKDALVPTASKSFTLTDPLIARLPVEVEVGVPVRDFRVRNLLALDIGSVIETQWGHSEDVPLRAGDLSLAWSEFEVIETQLAVRVTRLA